MLLETWLPGLTIRSCHLQVHIDVNLAAGMPLTNTLQTSVGKRFTPSVSKANRSAQEQGAELCSRGRPKDNRSLDGYEIYRGEFRVLFH